MGWVAGGAAAAALTAGGVLYARAHTRATTARRPDQWADVARVNYEQARQEASWAGYLLVGGGLTSLGAAALFIW